MSEQTVVREEGTSAGVLLAVLVVLLVLAGVSLALRFAHLGTPGILVALGIAAVKAVLVVIFFMELRDESPSVRIAFLSAFGLLATMLALVVADVFTRTRAPDSPPETVEMRQRG
jgi:cytochrome c oxidase subunit 4